MSLVATDATPAGLRRFAKFVAASTLFLVFAGAMVTSTGSGLSVPDWPLSYGMLMPPMVGGIFYEHGHRMIAATVGLLTLIQAFWLQRREPKRHVRILGWCALGAVVAQGVLGGMTVLFLLPPAISVSHAGLAEIFLCLNFSIALTTSEWFARVRAMERVEAPTISTAFLAALVYAQILVGATMRHLGAGLAIPDFPLSFGKLVPDLSSAKVAVNFTHRTGAWIVAIVVIAIASQLLRSKTPLRPIAAMLLGIVVLQITLGAATVWSGKQPIITSFHVVTGASTLVLSVILAITARAMSTARARSRQAGAFVANGATA